MRLIDADAIPYTMLYKENWMGCAGIEKQGVWKDTIDAMPTIEPEIKCIANVTLTDEQVKEAFEKVKCEILAAQFETKSPCSECQEFDCFGCKFKKFLMEEA